MKQYQDMLRYILNSGVDKEDRTGTGTRSIFGHQMRFNLQEGFPIVTTKFTPFRLVVTELLWFLKGNPDISYLHKHNNHIWDEWVKTDGTFGPIYGKQWRSWPVCDGQNIDQITNVIETLKKNPDDRRMIVSAWNVADVESGEMALPPCHVMFQFYSAPMSISERIKIGDEEGKLFSRSFYDDLQHSFLDQVGIPRRRLSCQLYQRSCDTFLGVPFNIASYALLTHMVAHLTDHAVGDFIWTGGDTHIYKNHFGQVVEVLSRDPLSLPRLVMTPRDSIDAFIPEDFRLDGYEHHPAIKAPVAV